MLAACSGCSVCSRFSSRSRSDRWATRRGLCSASYRVWHGGRQGDFGGELGSESLSTGVLGRAMVSLLVRDFILNLSGVTSTSKGFGNAMGETDLVAGVAGAGVRYPDIRAGEQGSG